MVLAILGTTIGCEQTPETVADCVKLTDAVEQENCYFGFAQAAVQDRAALQQTIQAIPSATSRDLLRLRMAVQDPVRLGWLCKNVEGTDAQTRCSNIVRRPHLLKPPPGAR